MYAIAALTLGVSLLSWVVLWLSWGGFWKTDQLLSAAPPTLPGNRPWPALKVIIPARNEADMLPETLPTLLGQEYPGPLQVCLVDDHSDDGTGEVARALARNLDQERRLTVIQAAPLQKGWTGKLWALEQGVRASRADTDSEYLLFTDADIAYGPGQLQALVAKARIEDLDLVSLMVLLRVKTFWERLLIPAFVYFFAMLYPFKWVNDPGKRTAAAAGGCVLLRRQALERSGGLAPIAGALIDDCTLARQIKDRGAEDGGRIWLGLTGEVKSLRPYQTLEEIWTMVARTAFVQLHYSYLLLLGTVAGMLLLYLAPPLGAAASPAAGPRWGIVLPGLAAWLLMIRTYLPMLKLYRVSPWLAPLLPMTAALYTAMTLDSARRFRRGKGGLWKGRTYESTGP